MLQTAARTVKVLAVDDSPAFLRTLALILDSDPSVGSVSTATSGDEALSMAQLSQPDVVLIDLHMPRKNGLDTAADLRVMYPDVPVIILTAHQMRGLRHLCRQNGALEMIPKSELAQELPRLLRQIRDSLEHSAEA